jgi:hypothetical protein
MEVIKVLWQNQGKIKTASNFSSEAVSFVRKGFGFFNLQIS